MMQKFVKRTAEELEPAGGGGADAGFGEPPVKLQCTQAQHQHQQGPGGGGGGGPHHGHGQHPSGNGANSTGGGGGGGGGANEGLTKFSVEIVQQLEFTTSAANSQAQQISTNVTVKALTNASVKSDLLNASSSPKSGPDTPASGNARPQAGNGTVPTGAATSGAGGPTPGGIGCVDIGNLVECKQEPDNEFVDLEQCAAALEKDAAANGAGFPGFSDFMGDDTGDEIITSDAFKDLISEISDFHPEFMKDFDFEEKIPVDALANNVVVAAAAAAAANNNNNNNNSIGTNNGQIKIEDDKDAIHHGNANSNSVNNGTANNGSNVQANSSPGGLGSAQYSPARLPYSGLDFKSEMSPAAQTLKQMAEQHQHKSQQLSLGGFNPGAAAAGRGPTARSPYAEFTQFGNTSDYLGSPGSAGPPGGQPQATTGTAYHKNNGAAGFQSQQTNDMFVGSQTQFATGLADMKRPQPGTGGKPSMLGPSGGYKQPYSPYGSPGSMPNHGSPGYPLPPRGSQGSGPNQTGSQGPFTSSTPPRPPSGPGTSTLQINQAQQLHINNPGHQIQVSAGQHMQLTGDLKPNVSVAAQQGMYFTQQPSQNQSGPGGQTDTYCSVSQSQTINFTQQSLRQRAAAAAAGGVPQPAGAPGARNHPQQVPPNQVDQHQHAKIIQQQQLMRAQQAMQQQHMAGGMGGVRPPPPEYKAAQAQMMHAGIGMGQQARFPNAGAMRRVTQQPMPPSGPMMRPQMAQQQQQALHAAGGNMYMGGGGGMAAIGGMHQMHQRLGYPRTNNQRPPNVSVGPADGLGNSIAGRGAQQEWRHVLMQQQGFQMRSQFNQQGHQGGFGMGGTGGMQMNAAQMQHQQLIRSQQGGGGGGGGIGGTGMANSTQMQQLLSQQHQQQTLAMQQSNNQMSLQMQMSQSSSVNSVTSTGTGSPLHPHQQYGAGSPGVRSMPQQQQQQQHAQPVPVTSTDPSVAAADFSLEFLENLPTGDTSNFSAQELLNSLDSTAGFNLDIL
ncbi:neurogenic protein mastermind isoform X2 [Ceratina calcarata]|uniref:Neurogenic protein mastermind isoform X2 n=1 Tax=Ceratina calcarata TaxID=156304 RepID=A0AAJ7NAN8_9HYME|nr:neurogenic protein mastermind isoform X2 [Ceratina calcarata]